MARPAHRYRKKLGKSPGSMEYVGRREALPTKLTLIDYDAEHFESRPLERVDPVRPFLSTDTVTWLDVSGLRDTQVLERIGKEFDIHPLIMEDVLNTTQRPKAELSDAMVFIVLRMVQLDEKTGRLVVEQVSLILGKNYLITFQELPGDVFDSVRERLKSAKGHLRHSGPDYLAYAIMDSVVDHYFVVLEHIGEQIEVLEGKVLENPDKELVAEIHRLRRDLVAVRRATWPLREEIGALLRTEHSLVDKATLPYLRDLHDHTIRVIETVETHREMATALLDIYLSNTGNRLNEVMKMLTIIATIFIPLTFMAGIYGMNFEYMPELSERWAYPTFLIVCVAVAVSMLAFFRRKRWL
jgi:magnesium transporter